ncbi:MAG TPA: hypothetical protein VHJ58_19155 [Vicinamibacterales bacterium]|nr:hypothetical protein [Vicinamibacterales bacterium]
MAKTYRPYLPEQDLLLPPSLRDWLPEDHLAYFVSDLIDRVSRQPCGTQGNGPYPIRWEQSDHHEQATVMQTLDLPSVAPTTETIARIERLSPAGFVKAHDLGQVPGTRDGTHPVSVSRHRKADRA